MDSAEKNRQSRERRRRFVARHPEKIWDICACGKQKQRVSLSCRACTDQNKKGLLSPYYKGGYACHLEGMRKYYERRRDASGMHTEAEWESLKTHFGFMCLCCKQREPVISLQRDHIIPLVQGGTDTIDNIQPLCASCNSQKYTKIINFIALHESNKAAGDV